MKHNATANAGLPKNFKNARRTQRKPAMGPGQGCILKQNPAIAPRAGNLPQLRERALPSLFGPRNLNGFKAEPARCAVFAELFAIIRDAIGRMVTPSQEQDDLFSVHFSTK